MNKIQDKIKSLDQITEELKKEIQTQRDTGLEVIAEEYDTKGKTIEELIVQMEDLKKFARFTIQTIFELNVSVRKHSDDVSSQLKINLMLADRIGQQNKTIEEYKEVLIAQDELLMSIIQQKANKQGEYHDLTMKQIEELERKKQQRKL